MRVWDPLRDLAQVVNAMSGLPLIIQIGVIIVLLSIIGCGLYAWHDYLNHVYPNKKSH